MNIRTLSTVFLLCLGCSGIVTFFASMITGFTIPDPQKMFQEREIPLRLEYFTKIIEMEKNYKSSLEALRQKDNQGHGHQYHLWIIDASGRIVEGDSILPLPKPWNEIPRDLNPHSLKQTSFMFKGPRGPRGEAQFLGQVYTIRLDNTEAYYLVYYGVTQFRPPPPIFLFISLGISVFSFLLAVFSIFVYLRIRAKEADHIINKLESGDLKARFPIRRFDQMAKLLLKFNAMADSIEHLVTKLKDTENARTNILSDLGHDLRTPLTSMLTAVDGLSLDDGQLPAAHRQELLEIVRSDIRYFEKMIRDLFFLSKMSVVKFRQESEKIYLSRLLLTECNYFNSNAEMNQKGALKMVFTDDCKEKCHIRGDQNLITRLIKNLFNNASQYARQTIQISLSQENQSLIFMIKDDGPGMTEADLASYGTRRKIRIMDNMEKKHISLNLGSVIVKNIVEMHGGTLEVKNRVTESSRTVCGLKIRIAMPIVSL
jgi:signal transduction histidine kinase